MEKGVKWLQLVLGFVCLLCSTCTFLDLTAALDTFHKLSVLPCCVSSCRLPYRRLLTLTIVLPPRSSTAFDLIRLRRISLFILFQPSSWRRPPLTARLLCRSLFTHSLSCPSPIITHAPNKRQSTPQPALPHPSLVCSASSSANKTTPQST